MAELSIWLECSGAEAFVRQADVCSALERAGMSVRLVRRPVKGEPGIVCLSRLTDSTCTCVRDASGCGTGRVIALAAEARMISAADAWRLLQAGASDVLSWDGCRSSADAIAQRFARWQEIDLLTSSPVVRTNLVGESRAWTSLMREVVEVARFTDLSVLITGETGTGKELVARLIHTLDSRPEKGELVILDCATVVPELSGSEFFGHERGAFTHAFSARDGAFALADGGTLFVDEIGELPLHLQAELLRVVQERTYKRVGGNTWHKARFRLICATNRAVDEEIRGKTFRADLFHRLAAWRCHLPPLRDRREDILPMARHFLTQLCPETTTCDFDETVRAVLTSRDYPGNVRELRQLVARLASRHVGNGPITVGALPPDERPKIPDETAAEEWRDGTLERAVGRALAAGAKLRELREGIVDLAIQMAVENEGGSLQRASRRLGVTDRALQLRQAQQRKRGYEQATDRSPHEDPGPR